MLGFNFSSVYVKIIIVLVLSGIIISGFFYIKHLNSQLQLAQVEQSRLQEVIQAQQTATQSLRTDVDRIANIQEDLFSRINRAQTSTRDLERKFTQNARGEIRNFSDTARSRPSLTEMRVNAATRDALRCNEVVTGSPLNESELSGQTRNTICPDIIKPRE